MIGIAVRLSANDGENVMVQVGKIGSKFSTNVRIGKFKTFCPIHNFKLQCHLGIEERAETTFGRPLHNRPRYARQDIGAIYY